MIFNLIYLFLLQCVIQYVLILVPSTRTKMKHLYNFAGHFIYSNSTPKNYNICDRMAIHLFSKSVKIILLILFPLYLTACVPLCNIYFNRSTSGHDFNQFVIPIIMPFIDPFTQQGFCMNLANQILICLIGAIALPIVELITCVMMNNISASAAVIANTLTEFGETIKRKNQFSAENTWKFRNIIVQIMDFDRFSSQILFASIASSELPLIFVLFLQVPFRLRGHILLEVSNTANPLDVWDHILHLCIHAGKDHCCFIRN